MSDSISRHAAIEAVRVMQTYKLFAGDDMILIDKAEVQTELMTLPSADKTGKWILSDNQSREDMENGNYYYFCSNCLHGDVHAKTQEVPYCWHCGAKMKGGTDDCCRKRVTERF